MGKRHLEEKAVVRPTMLTCTSTANGLQDIASYSSQNSWEFLLSFMTGGGGGGGTIDRAGRGLLHTGPGLLHTGPGLLHTGPGLLHTGPGGCQKVAT